MGSEGAGMRKGKEEPHYKVKERRRGRKGEE